jgi:hypothetical protein
MLALQPQRLFRLNSGKVDIPKSEGQGLSVGTVGNAIHSLMSDRDVRKEV